jgi:predicted PurR-regulated permease PerM
MNAAQSVRFLRTGNPSMCGDVRSAESLRLSRTTAGMKPEPQDHVKRNDARVTYALKVLALVTLAVFMLVSTLQFLAHIPAVTAILIGTLFFTYLVYPAVRWIHRRGPSLGAAIAIVYCIAAALVALTLSFVVPPLVNEVRQLAAASPGFIKSAQGYIADPNSFGLRYVPEVLRDYLETLPQQIGDYIQASAAAMASRFLAILLSTFGVIATLVVIPILSIYLIFEAETLTKDAIGLIPLRGRPETLRVLADLDKVLGGFVRGQVIVGATVGVLITIGLLITHVPYALLIGVLAGVLDIIPYIGAIATFVPAVALAFASGGWQHALIVALIFIAVFQLEGHFIAPRIVSESVGLSPLVVIVAVLIGGELLGIPGMFLAVPVAGMVRVLRIHFIATHAPV